MLAATAREHTGIRLQDQSPLLATSQKMPHRHKRRPPRVRDGRPQSPRASRPPSRWSLPIPAERRRSPSRRRSNARLAAGLPSCPRSHCTARAARSRSPAAAATDRECWCVCASVCKCRRVRVRRWLAASSLRIFNTQDASRAHGLLHAACCCAVRCVPWRWCDPDIVC